MERRHLFSCLIENIFVLDINLHLVTLYPPSYFVPLFSNSWFISANNLTPLGPPCPCGNTLSWARSSSAWIARMGVGTGIVASVSGSAWSPHFFFATGDLYTASTAAPLLGVLHHNIFSLQQHSSKVFCSEGDAWGIPNWTATKHLLEWLQMMNIPITRGCW